MSRSLAVAGLLIDSWRDQSPQTEPGEMTLPGGETPISRCRGASDDGSSAPLLASLHELGAVRWESRSMGWESR